MVLVSIHPFAFRKILLVIAALLCFSAFCFADPVFMAEHYTLPSGSSAATQHEANATVQRVDLPSREQRRLTGVERGGEIGDADNPDEFLPETA